MQSQDDQGVHHSIKAYSKAGLSVYDGLVMGVLAKHVWGCTPDNFVRHYRKHMTANHAEIGVGTGYCIDRCGFDTLNPRLVLIDLQKNCLEYSAKRLARFEPDTYIRNVCHPIHIDAQRFDSIALGGVLHCLPGDMRQKGKVFDALQPIAGSGTTVFGYSLVKDGVRKPTRRRLVHNCLNRLRVIDNDDDRLADLDVELSRRFAGSRVELVGSIAFFSAVVPAEHAGSIR